MTMIQLLNLKTKSGPIKSALVTACTASTLYVFSCVHLQLIGGLGDEKGRWQDSVNKLEQVINSIVGDVLVSAGFVAYLGPFTVS